MSQYQSNGIVKSSRAQQQIERLQAILFERNQQLQTVENQLTKTEKTVKHARRKSRLLTVFCALLIVVLALGGVA
ncbi:hypothetical protein ACQKDA_00155 [Psychrobacter sp. NPDC078370]|uniref:hypothetical protein n=1 Tax=unclassified Psychrobacter TaxID=196806 RepID=UPI003CFE3741